MSKQKFISTKVIPAQELELYIEEDERTGKWMAKVIMGGYSYYIGWDSRLKIYITTPRMDLASMCSTPEGAEQIANCFEP